MPPEDPEYEEFLRRKKTERILREIRVSGSTIPLDLSLKFEEDVDDIEKTLSEMMEAELVESHEGYFHLTYKGLRHLRRLEEG